MIAPPQQIYSWDSWTATNCTFIPKRVGLTYRGVTPKGDSEFPSPSQAGETAFGRCGTHEVRTSTEKTGPIITLRAFLQEQPLPGVPRAPLPAGCGACLQCPACCQKVGFPVPG
jgi:hypothetical protein